MNPLSNEIKNHVRLDLKEASEAARESGCRPEAYPVEEEVQFLGWMAQNLDAIEMLRHTQWEHQDWGDDVDDTGRAIGRCPKCECRGIARVETDWPHGRWRWLCTVCTHFSPWRSL